MGFVNLKALKNANFLSLASNLGTAVFGVLSFMILVRSLAPNIFGEWVLYIAAGNFIEMLRFGITRTAIIRFLSGSSGEKRHQFIGSNWAISLYATLILAALIWLVYILFPVGIKESGYSLFFIWYPVLSILNLPFNNALTVKQADQRFDQIFFIRMFNVGSFVLFLLVNILFLKLDILMIVYVHLIINLLTSIICMFYKWDGIQYFFKATKESNKTILDFGKYSTGTLIGANLLKSSDTFLIGLSAFLGTTGVAMYSVPLKLTEILEIPLRSFAFTAFPKMSKASMENNVAKVKQIFYSYSGGLTLIIIPIVIICFIFAEEFIYILGGPEYIETKTIFRIFCIYGLFISIDKFTGIALDSINKPKKNFIKVVYMASANIIGDIIAIFYVSKLFVFLSLFTLIFYSDLSFFGIADYTYQFSLIATLEMVAFVTILFTIIGIAVGFNYLNKELSLNLKYIPIEGWKFFMTIIKDVLSFFVKQKS